MVVIYECSTIAAHGNTETHEMRHGAVEHFPELAARLLREAVRALVQLLAGGEEEAAVGERESRRAEVRVESVFGDVPALGHVRRAVHDAHQVVVGDLAGDVLAAAEPVRENGEDAVSADEY